MPEPGNGSYVRVTLVDIYEELVALRADVAALVPSVPDHEQRIRSLERWRYALPPALILGVGSVVLTVVLK